MGPRAEVGHAEAASPLWERTAAEPVPSAPPLTEDVACDVAVVGGGYTGLSTALHAAERGLQVRLLEAERVGAGGSGRNVGLVNAGLWLAPDAVERALGAVHGPRLLALLANAPADVMALVQRHGIDCELTRTGTIHAAHAPRGLAELRRRAEAWRRRGAPVELLDRDEMVRRVGTARFPGGLLDPRAGTLNPMAYARGLARAAQAAGATLHERSPALAIEAVGGGWRVRCAQGSLTAPKVVLATNAYGRGLWPGLERELSFIHYFNLATEPLGARLAHVLPERQGLWDTAPIMSSLRRDAFGRLILGSMGRVRGGTRGLTARWAARRLRRLFPDLGPVRFESAWHGRIAMTGDHLPRLLRPAEGVFAPMGYNGRGITTGTVIGRELAAVLAGAPDEALPLPPSAPRAGSRAGRAPRLREPFLDAVFTLNQIWGALR